MGKSGFSSFKNRPESVFEPTIPQRCASAAICIFIGLILAQLLRGWPLYHAAVYNVTGSFIFTWRDMAALLFLAGCGIFGWFKGQWAIDKLWEEIRLWDWWWLPWK